MWQLDFKMSFFSANKLTFRAAIAFLPWALIKETSGNTLFIELSH